MSDPGRPEKAAPSGPDPASGAAPEPAAEGGSAPEFLTEPPPPEPSPEPVTPSGASEEIPSEASEEIPAAPGRRRLRPSRKGCLWTFLALAVTAGAFTIYEAATWPDVAALRTRNPATTAFIERFRRDHPGSTVSRRWVGYGAIAPQLKQAVLVGEDIDFFSHDGFDLDQIRVALRDAWDEKSFPRGASTVTQQLAKNLWLSPSRNPFRKVKEAILTRQLERDLGKRRILELYLNVVEFGPGVFGAEAGAEHYFGESASALTARQAAELAAGLPKPSRWHPGSDSRAYARRVEKLLARMEKAVFLLRRI